MNRFTVVQMNPKNYWIRDSQHRSFGMPERAVTINFGNPDSAQTVCTILNTEWKRFCLNPN